MPDLDRIHLVGVQVLAVEKHLAFGTGSRDQLVHAVEGPQQGGFAAAGGADNGGDTVAPDAHIDTAHGFKITVENAQVLGLDHVIDACRLRHQNLRVKRLRITIAEAFRLSKRMSRITIAAAARWRHSACGRDVHW